jgi:DNA-binding CsgD family transcriptional regulator
MKPRDRLLAFAADLEGLVPWRAAALGVLRELIPFDAAILHELSPRVSLARAALMGVDRSTLEANRRRWDDDAVALGILRDRALAQGGAATDDEAFPPGSSARKRWHARVARPLRLRSALVGHLVVRRRIVAVVLLGRRRSPAFDVRERVALARLLPTLAVADALQQHLETGTVRGPAAALECVDLRLTPRQREVVVQVALGHTNAQIGQALRISPHTVRNLLAQVCTRLHAANRAEVVRLAVLR